MLDRDESALHARAALDRRPGPARPPRPRPRRHPRPRRALAQVFAEHRPDVVFHAAALKHLPLLEQHPGEAVKTNVLGHAERARGRPRRRRRAVRQHLHRQGRRPEQRARLHQAGRRAAHRRVDGRARRRHLPQRALRQRARQPGLGAHRVPARRSTPGGPVTVTHPDVTRYFMTVEEAVQLVIQAGADRRRRRGAGARHGRAGADRRRRPPADRRSVPAAGRDRVHRPAARREAARGPASATTSSDERPVAPADLARAGAAAGAPAPRSCAACTTSGASHDQLIDRLRAAALAHPLDGADGVPGPHFPLSQPTGLPAAAPGRPAGRRHALRRQRTCRVACQRGRGGRAVRPPAASTSPRRPPARRARAPAAGVRLRLDRPGGPRLPAFESEAAALDRMATRRRRRRAARRRSTRPAGVGVGPGDEVLVPTFTFAASGQRRGVRRRRGRSSSTVARDLDRGP